MARRLDRILVVDIESTCWEKAPPPGETSDIIEIGICELDVTRLERLGKRSILVRPTRSEVSEFCSQLTTITSEMVRDAPSLADAVKTLRDEYGSRDRLWASWGDYDRRQFERVCKDLGVSYPFGQSHLNVKSLFAVTLGLRREVGMEQACSILGRSLEGTHHRGHDDAWNIAGILAELLAAKRDLASNE